MIEKDVKVVLSSKNWFWQANDMQKDKGQKDNIQVPLEQEMEQKMPK